MSVLDSTRFQLQAEVKFTAVETNIVMQVNLPAISFDNAENILWMPNCKKKKVLFFDSINIICCNKSGHI